MRRHMLAAAAAALGILAVPVLAQQRAEERVQLRTKVVLKQIDEKGTGATLGTVTFTDTPQGVAIEADIAGLPPGIHGFHVHENPDCGPKEKDGKLQAGLAAGEHYDPHNAKAHRGPARPDSHLGDLPVLVVDKDGRSNARLVAPRLKVADLRGRALVVHAGGDNYADTPQPTGGGGARIACGVFEIKMAD